MLKKSIFTLIQEDFNSILTESYHSTTDSDKNYSDHSPRILIAKRNKQKKLKSINLSKMLFNKIRDKKFPNNRS